MKKLLFYRYGAVTEEQTAQSLDEMQIPWVGFEREMKDYHADSAFAQAFLALLHSAEFGAVFSYDYFPLLSMMCELNRIPYLSWVYDCPLMTLQSETIKNESNHIFCFDRVYAERLVRMGAKHCHHFPLAVRTDRAAVTQKGRKSNYACEISFLGNLYNEEKNRLRGVELSPYAKGYVEGLLNVQKDLYGCNLIRDALDEEVISEIAQKCRLQLGDLYITNRAQMVSDAVNMELSARDREAVLLTLLSQHSADLYCASRLPKALAGQQRLRARGYADYKIQMPLIFRDSKINLNITSRTIESGIPLRVLDILSCQGFCITNYQPEIAESFEDGKDLVMYTGLEDLREKASYYLAHDEEREEIARAGYETVCRSFEMKDRLRGIFRQAAAYLLL